MIICDRFDGGFAVIYDDDKHYNVPRSKIASDVKEGDVLYLVNGIYYPDKEKTKEMREYNIQLMKRLGL